MENPTPFDLNEAIRRWQESFGASRAFGADNLEELASHLRASVQRLQADGLSEEEAFQIAVRRLGERGALERELAKVHRWERIILMLATVTAWSCFAATCLTLVRLSHVQATILEVQTAIPEEPELGSATSHFKWFVASCAILTFLGGCCAVYCTKKCLGGKAIR